MLCFLVLYLYSIKSMRIYILLMLVVFFVSHLVFEKYLIIKIEDKIRTFPVMLITLSIEFVFLTLAAYINGFTTLLGLVTIINASFINVFYRHKLSKINGGM